MEPARRRFAIGESLHEGRPLEPALYLVATPIGNLGDITLRALETLAAADIVACEDTRVTRVLLDRYGLDRRPVAYHEHNAERAGPKLLAALEDGRSVALVSDAGTPLVSDPGHRLVRQAIDRGLKVVPVPGPSAVLAALTASGLPTDAFHFAGFLSAKGGQRRNRLEALKSVPGTLVVFESPRRLGASLKDMAHILGGNRKAAVARELTKAFEEHRRGTLADLSEAYSREPAPKGEIVVCIGPPDDDRQFTAEETDRLLVSLASEMPASRAAAQASKMTGVEKSKLYKRLLDLKAPGDS